MSAGATGPAARPELSDRTKLEMEAGNKLNQYYRGPGASPPQSKPDPAAKVGVQAKSTTGRPGIFIVPNEPTASATAFAGLPTESLVEGIESEVCSADRSQAPRVLPKSIVPFTATVTLTANKAEDRGNKPQLPSPGTEAAETSGAAAMVKQPNIQGSKGETADQSSRKDQSQQSKQQTVPNVSQPSGDVRDSFSKPNPIKPNFENFPLELKSLTNWVLWRFLAPSSNGGKWRKVPFQPNGKTADTTDRSTWSGFDECCAAYNRGGFDGVGFVFDGEIGKDGLSYCGVDFDDCVRDGKVQPLAQNRMEQLNTYSELSVSGTGIHCIARAEPLDRPVKFDGVEVYTTARYFTFTGVAP